MEIKLNPKIFLKLHSIQMITLAQITGNIANDGQNVSQIKVKGQIA